VLAVTKVHSAPHPFELENLRNVLQIEGISSEVRTPFLGAARGDIPSTECWSELWVHDDKDVDRAAAVIAAVLQPSERSGPSWRCRTCGEENEQQFGACWQCGSEGGDRDA
jgi:Putative prokaryotic signal transducing protein